MVRRIGLVVAVAIVAIVASLSARRSPLAAQARRGTAPAPARRAPARGQRRRLLRLLRHRRSRDDLSDAARGRREQPAGVLRRHERHRPGERDSHSAAAAPGRRSTLTFDLHNRHTYSEEQVRANRAFARYTATIGVLTMDNTLISRAAVQNEFRTSDGSGRQDWRRRRSRRPEGGRADRNRAHLHRHSRTGRRRERPRREVERGAVGRQCELHVAGTADRGHQQRHDRVRSDAAAADARPRPLGSAARARAACWTGSPSRRASVTIVGHCRRGSISPSRPRG